MRFRTQLSTLLFLLLTAGCAGASASTTPKPKKPPVLSNPTSLRITRALPTEAGVTYTLQCVVPTNPPGGAIDACRWDISVDGARLSPQPADGFTATVTIPRPAPTVAVNFSATVWSVRRGLVSATSFTQTWTYTEPDVAPPAVTDITTSFTETVDSLILTAACVIPSGQGIETCAWGATKAVGTGGATPITVPNGFTARIATALPAPTQTVTFQLLSTSVRRGLSATPFSKSVSFTRTDTPPPGPTNITIQVIIVP